MSQVQKITLSQLKEAYSKGIRIPEIQRDYVMGAGGKTDRGEDKLKLLLDAIWVKFNNKEDFDFSCIITYCKDTAEEPLEIYDGQQRLTTLMLLVLYKLCKEKSDEIKNYKNWYSFAGRKNADAIVNSLTDDNFNIENIQVTDFTSFSMKNLLKVFADDKYKAITSEYLLNHVKFDRVELGSQSEIEQFFMDLNSGVKLKEYELYKAKLVNHIYTLKEKCLGESLKQKLEEWPHCVDNEWLNIFKPFADFNHPAEEYEIAFIQYCFDMLCVKWEIVLDEKNENISKLTTDVLMECFEILNSLTKVDFYRICNKSNKGKEQMPTPTCVEFAWGKSEECQRIVKCYNFDKRGAYWNLRNEAYEEQLFFVIKKVLLDEKQKNELRKDVIVWAYITTLTMKIDYQYEYLRLLKIVLNRNYGENSNAWYECQGKGQYLYYSKYSVMDIPQYYGKHLEDSIIKKTGLVKREEILQVHFLLSTNIVWKRSLDRMEIAKNIMENIFQMRCSQIIKSIVKERLEQMENVADYHSFCEKENCKCGYDRDDVQTDYYLAENISLYWPTRSSSDCINNCCVLLRNDIDQILEGKNDKNNQLVEEYYNCFNNLELDLELDKMFWDKGTACAYKIMNRSTPTAKTYAKKNSLTEFWAEKYFIENNAGKVERVLG